MAVLGNLKKGLVFVVSAPAGAGKTTLIKKLISEFPCIVQSISYTTRAPRKGEVEGKDYFFISREEFQKKVRNGEFLESAQVFDHFYGTSKKQVEMRQKEGKHVVLVIDTQGAHKIRDLIDATFIFIMPPSINVLKERLLKRSSEKSEDIEKRLLCAKKEIACAKEYDYQLVNDDLEEAYEVLKAIFIAKEHSIK